MGAVADAVSDVFEDTGINDAVEGVVDSVGDIPQSLADTANHIVENVSDYVVNFVEDPTKIFTDPVQAVSDSFALFDDVVTQTATAPISQVTSALDDAIIQPITEPISDLGVAIDDKVNEVVPGGWATVGQIALAFAAPGLGTALGTAMLGAGASTFAAATLGGAVLGAGTGALTASLRGGDPLKGALAGAAGGGFGGAVSFASMDIAASIVGGGDPIAGLLTLKEMSAATGISTTQLANVVSNSVASGIAGAATGKGDVASLIGTSLVASGVGAYAGSIVNGIDPGQLNSAVAAASSVANIGTRAALAGNDISDAIAANAPSLLANTISSEFRPPASQKTNDATRSVTTAMWGEDTANKYSDMIFAGDTSEFDPGTKVTLADGSIGVVSGNGTIVPEGTVSDTTTVSYKEPTGSVTLSDEIEDSNNLPADTTTKKELTPEEQYNELMSQENMTTELAEQLSGFSPPPPEGPLSTLDTGVPNVNEVDTTSPLSVLDATATDTKSPLSTLDTAVTDTTSPLSTLDTAVTDTTGPLSLSPYDTVVTEKDFTSGKGDPGYETYLALNPGGGLSYDQWKWQSQEPELGESDEWRQKYKEWQAQNPDLKAGTLDVIGTKDPEEEAPVEEDPTKEDPTKLPSVKIPTTTPSVTIPKITLPNITIPTTTTAAPASTKSAFQPAADATSGIPNLTPGLTKAMNDYQLTGLNAIDTTPEMAGGGSTSAIDDLNSGKDYNPMASSALSYLKPGLTRANLQYALTGMPAPKMHKADGGEIMQEDLSMPEGHHPEFFSEGGLHNRYVRGDGDGTSNDVPAMLANGEFVIPADVVASLGNGDNDSGAKVLDEFLAVIRKHKRAADAKHLPPDSKGALGYLAEAHSKVRA